MLHFFRSQNDPALFYLIGGTLGLLITASVIGFVLARNATSDAAKATMANLNARTRAWWMMVAVFATALAVGPLGKTVTVFQPVFLNTRVIV